MLSTEATVEQEIKERVSCKEKWECKDLGILGDEEREKVFTLSMGLAHNSCIVKII